VASQRSSHELLDASVGELSVPRLFVALPKVTSTVGNNGDSRSSQFRLHFLCEPSADTKAKTSEELKEVHFANHPGYDLTKSCEFFDKYGSYLLTMAYMVKFRSMAGSRLWPSHVKNETGTKQDHLSYIRNNIHGLIDETIRHLERMTGDINGDVEDIAHRTRSALELGQVEQYLKVEDGECNSGDLTQTVMHDGYYVWACDEHQYRYHRSTMSRLEKVIEVNGGKCSRQTRTMKINMRTASEPLTKMFRDLIVQLHNTQTSENQRSLKVLDLKLCSIGSTCSTTDIFIDRTGLCSLEMTFARLSLTIRISEGEVQDSVMEFDCLNDLTQGDLDFIQQCRPVQLLIKDAPEKEDEDRLVNILQQNPTLTGLDIRCIGDRSFAAIDFIVSTMEKIRQDMGSSSLRTSKVVGRCFGINKSYRSSSTVTVMMSISMDSDSLNMVTDILLPDQDIPSESPMCKFITLYGWSIRTLTARYGFSDYFATLLDEGTRVRGSKITNVDLDPRPITVSVLDALDRVIKRSLSFTGIRLELIYLKNDTVMTLFERYGDKLYDLYIHEEPTVEWIHELTRAFPTRESFPVLRHLDLNVPSPGPNIPQAFVDWIVSMVSAPSPVIINSPSSTAPLSEESEVGSFTPLNTIKLENVQLQPGNWESLIGAIDLSSLVGLNLHRSNFSQEQLKLLVDRVDAFGPRPVSLKKLNIRDTGLTSNDMVRTLCEKLAARDPKIDVCGPE